MAKRRDMSDPTCLFCCEGESVNPLFFECCMSSNVWSIVSEILGREVGKSYENTAGLWIANKRHAVTSAVLWAIWNVSWTGLMVLLKIVGLLRRWMALFRQEIGAKVGEFASRLEVRACSPPQILWRPEETRVSSELEQSAAQFSVQISVASGLSESLLSVDGLPSLSSRRDAVFRS